MSLVMFIGDSDPTMKKCSRCGSILPLDQFVKGGNRDGRKSYCSECGKIIMKEWRAKNPDYRRNQEEIVRANPEKAAFRNKKWRAIREGKIHTLSEERWVPRMKENPNCPDCGVVMGWYQRVGNNGGCQLSSGSFDRIDCKEDYIEGNVRLTCFGCNGQKGTIPVDEWVVLLKYRVKKGLIACVDEVLLQFLSERAPI